MCLVGGCRINRLRGSVITLAKVATFWYSYFLAIAICFRSVLFNERNDLLPGCIGCLWVCVWDCILLVQLDTTVDALALACVLAQPFNAMVLSGAACSEHLESNYKALEVLERLDAATVMDLMATCCMHPTEYWNERSALAWN
jgi:hypothetical protein